MKRLYPNLASGFFAFLLLLLASESWGQVTTGGSGNWSSTALNAPWSGGVVPVAGQTVTINAGHTVTLDVNTAVTLTSITIAPTGTLITTGAFTVDATTITVNGTYTNGSSGAITFTTMNVNAGGIYDHAIDGGTVPSANWISGSNCNITGVTNNTPSGFEGQNFGNLTWNCPGQLGSGAGGAKYLEANFDVQNDFQVLSTGATSSLRMTNTNNSYIIGVTGNMAVTGSTFKMNNYTAAFGQGACTLNVSGNLTLNSGNFTIVTGNASSSANVTGDVFINGGTFLMQEDFNASVVATLNLGGNLFIAGGATVTENDTGNGEINFTGGAAQNFTNNGTLSNEINITINQAPASTVTLLTPTNFPADLTITTGTFDTNGQTVTFDGTIDPQTITGPATQSFDNVIVNKGAGELLTTAGITTLNVADFTLTQGDFTAPATLTTTGDVTLSAGTHTAGTNTNVGGDWTNDGGAFTAGAGTVTFDGGGANVIDGTAVTQTFNDLIINKGGGSLSVGGSTTSINVDNLTLTAGNFSATTNTNVSGDWTNNGGTFTPGTGTVTFNGGVPQAINGSAVTQTFNDVVVNKGGASTLTVGGSTTTLNVDDFTQTLGNFTAPATLTATGGITFTAGTYTAGTNTNIGGDWINNGGTFTAGSGTVTFNGAGAQTISGSSSTTFYNVATSGGSDTDIGIATIIGNNLVIGDGTSFTVPAPGYNLTVTGFTTVGGGTSGNLTINSATGTKIFAKLVTVNAGGTWDNTGNSPVTFRGGITNNATGTFNAGSGLHTFDTNPQILSGTLSIPDITATGITLTNNDVLTVGTSLAGTGGLTQAANATLNIGGTSTITTLDASAADNTVNYTGMAQTVFNINYVNLELSGSGVKILQAGTTTISGDLTLAGTASTTAVTGLTIGADVIIGAGTSITAGAFTHNVAGDWTNNGGAFTNAGSTIQFNGGAGQSINGTAATQSFNNIIINKGGASTLSVGGSTTTINIANLTLFAGSFTAPANTNISGNFTNNGTSFNAGGGTVTLNGTGLQVIGGGTPTTFNNLTTANTTQTFVSTPVFAPITIGSSLIIADGTEFTIATQNFSVGGSTLVGTGASGLLEINNSGGTKTFTGLVTITTGGEWDNQGDAPIIFQGGITNSGTFTAGNGVHTFDTNPQALTGSLTLPTTTVDGITLTNNNSLIVDGDLTGTGGLFQAAAAILDLKGVVSISTLTASNAGNTVIYSGSSQTVKAVDYQNLTINQSTGEAILEAATTVNEVLDLSARNLNLGGYILTIGSAGSLTATAPSSSNMIIDGGGGEVRKVFSGDGSFNFLIGDNSGMLEYSPIDVTVSGTVYGGGAYIAAEVIDAKHPDNASAANFLTRYWEITPSGITDPTVDVSADYPAGDLSGAEVDISAAVLDGSFNQTTNPWFKFLGGLAGGTLTTTPRLLTDGQTSAFTGIRGANPSITIDLGATVELCEGSTVVLNTTLVGGDTPVLYSWSPTTDLSASTVANPTYTGNTPGGPTNYTVTVTDGNGIVTTDIIGITVTAAPTADAGAATDATCETTSYTVTDAAVTNDLSISWTEDGAGSFTGGTETTLNPVYNPVAADAGGTVTLTLTVTGNGSCVNVIDTKVLTVDEQPVADAGPLTAQDCDLDIQLNAVQSVVGSTGMWTVVPPSGDISFTDNTLFNPVVSSTAYGTYTLRFTETNGSCSDFDDIDVTFDEQPTATITTLGPVDECDLDVDLLATAFVYSGVTNAPTLTWSDSGPGVVTYNGGDPTDPDQSGLSVDTYGTYIFTWTETNGAGLCVATDNITVNFYEQPVADAGPLTAQDCDLDIQLNAVQSVVGSTGMWTVVPPSGDISFTDNTLFNPVVSSTAYGTYTLRFTETNGSCSDFDDIDVTFDEQPTATITTLGPVDECDLDVDLLATAFVYSGVTNAPTLTWSDSGPGVVTYNGGDPTDPDQSGLSVDTYGTYIFTWTETNGAGLCVATDNITVNFYEQPVADAGPLTAQDCDLDIQLNAVQSVVGSTGMWTVVPPSGDISFTDNTLFNPVVSSTAYGTYTLRFTETNGSCSDFDDIDVTFDEQPTATITTLGPVDECDLDVDLLATAFVYSGVTNAPTLTWSDSGPGVVTYNGGDPTDPDQSGLSVDTYGTYIFTWTETNGAGLCVATDNITVNFYEQPVADAGPLTAQDCDLDIQLNAVQSVVGSTGMWTVVPPSGDISFTDNTLFNPVVSSTAYGTYTLRFTETNGSCSDFDDIDVTFDEQPTATITTLGPVDECDLDVDLLATAFVYSGVTNAPTLTWSDSGPGVVTYNGGDPTDPDQSGLSVDTYGTYIFTWTETNGAGLCVATDNITVNFYEQPVADAGPLTAQDCDLDIQLNAVQSVVGSTGMWTVVPPSGDISFTDNTLFNPVVSSTAYGTYTLRFTETNGSCSDFDDIDVTFDEQPTATITTLGPVDECDLDVDLLATAFVYSGVTNAPTLTWSDSGPGVVTYNGGDPTDPDQSGLSVDTYGTYIFTWTETNGAGLCVATDNITVNFYEQPVADAGPLTAQDCDLDIQLNAVQSVVGSTGMWTVVPPSGDISFTDNTLFNPVVSSTAYGTYTLRFTETNGSCSDFDDIDVTFDEQPTATITTLGPVDECDLDVDLLATAFVYSGVTNAPTLTWSDSGPGVVTYNGGDPTDPDQSGLSVDTYGTYIFTWTETNGAGLCVATDNITVNFYEQPVADAGPLTAQDCDLDIQLNAVQSVVGSTGMWTVVPPSGDISFTDNTLFNPVVSSTAYGTYTLRFTETNGSCSDFDDIDVTFDEQPTATITTLGPVDECDLDVDLLATAFVYSGVTNAPTLTWSDSGPGVVTYNGGDPTDPDQSGLSVDTYGTYIFTWTETNGAGLCVATDNITVNFYEQPVADAGPLTAQDCDLDIQLNAVQSVVGSTGMWTVVPPSGDISFTDNTLFNPVVSSTAYGTYTLRFTETNGSCSDFDDIDVTFDEQPTATITTLGPVDECDLDVDLLATAFVYSGVTNAPTLTWSDSGPGVVTYNGGDPTDPDQSGLSVDTYGTYIFTWTETNGAGLCVATDNITVNFYEQPVADAGPLTAQDCDLDIQLNAVQSVVGSTGMWTVVPPSGDISFTDNTLFNPVVSSTAYGTYTLRFTETNGSCSDFDDIDVTFDEQPTATITTLGPVDECDLDVDLLATAFVYSGVTNAPTLTWSDSGPGVVTYNGGDPTDPDQSGLSVDTYGTYIFTWTETNGAGLCVATDNITVNFYEQPVADAGPLTAQDCDLDIQLNAVQSVVGSTGMWTVVPPSGDISFTDNTLFNPVVSSTAYGTYTLRFTETNGSCSDFDDIDVTFDEQPTATITTLGPVDECDLDVDLLATAFVYSGVTNAPTLTWSDSGPGVVTYNGGDPTDPDQSGLSVDTYGTYIFTWTETNGAGLCVATDNIVVNFYQTPTITNLPASTIICSGDQLAFTATSDVVDASITWTSAISANITGNSNGSGVLADVLVNTGTAVETVTYTYTATGPGPQFCTNGPVYVYTVTVNPSPDVVATPVSSSICDGTSTSIALSTTNGVTMLPSGGYIWTVIGSTNVSGFSDQVAPVAGPIAQTLNLNPTTNISGNVTYRISPVSDDGCIGTSVDVTVTVDPIPTIATSGDEDICSGDVTSFTLSNPNLVSGTDYVWTVVQDPGITGASDGNGNSVSQQLFNANNSPADATYNIRPQANGCLGAPIVVVVTVNPTPVWTVDDTGVTEICEGQTTNIVLDSPTQNAVISLISAVPSAGGMTGFPTVLPVNYIGPFPLTINDALTNGNPSAETVTYTYSISANGCSDPITKEVVITVNPGPIFSITNSLPTICSGDPTSVQLNSPTALAVITLTAIDDAGGTISGYPLVGSMYVDGAVITDNLSNSTNSSQTLKYTFSVSALGCTNVTTQDASIIVKPDPAPGWTVTNNDVSICEGEMTDIDLFSPTDFAVITITNVIPSDPGVGGFSPIGTTFNFNPTVPPSKITDALTNSTSIAQTVQYVFNITATGCSDPITKSTTVTIIPSPTFTINNTMPTICSNDMTSITLNSVNPGAIIELVGLTKTDPGVIGHDIVGNTYFPLPETITNTLLNPTNAPQDVVYEFRVSLAGCVNSVTQFATVTVNPSPTWAVTNNATTICEGQMTDIDLTSPTVGALVTIASISNPGGFISNFTPVSTVLPPLDYTLQDALLNSDVNPQSITYEFTITAAGCTDPISKFATVTVNPTPTFTITNPAPTDNICPGEQTNITLNTPISGGLVQITAVSAGPVTGASLVGATFPDGGVITDLLVNPTNIIQTVDYTFIATAPGCPSSGPQMTTVTVNPNPAMSVTNNLSTLCEGIATDIDLTSPTQNGIITLTAVTPSDPGLTGYTLPGATYNLFGAGPEIFDVLSNSTQSPQTIIYSFNVDANGCSNPVSQQVVVTVNPIPTFTVTNPSPTDEICSDQTTLITLGTLTQNGIISITNITLSDLSVTGFSPIGSAFIDGSIITDKLTNPTDNPQTVDYEFQVTANACTEPTTITERVTVFPNPVWTVTNNDLEICVGDMTDIDLFSPTQDAIITLDNVTTSHPSVTGFTIPTSTFATPFATPTIFDALTNGTNSPQTISYEFSIDANGCSDPLTKVVMVTINPTPTFTITNNLTPICSEATTSIDIASPTANAVITLTSVVPSSVNVVGFSSAGTTYLDGATITDILVNTGSAIETVDYMFSVNSNGCAGVSSITRTVTVNPEPDVAASQNVQTICDMDFTNIILSNPNSVPGTMFSWTVVQSAGITGATPSSGGTITQQLFNSTNAPGSATYTVTPDANGCNGDPITVIITVNPTPTVATSGDETVCSPGLTNISITNPNTVTGTTFSWTVLSVTNGILGANNGAGILIGQTLINPNNTISGTVTYRITPSANGCNGPTTDVTVTVNPPAVVSAGLDFDICADGIAGLGGSFARATTSITWSGYGGIISNANDPLATYTPSAAEITAGFVTLTISSNDPDGGGPSGPCPIVTDDVTITINPLPIVNIISPVDNQYAQSDPVQLLLADQVSPPGVWTGLGVLGGFYVPSAVIIIPPSTFTLDNLVYTYTDLNGCVNSDSKIIRVDEIPDIEFATKPGQDYCVNQDLVDLFDDLNPNITTGIWAGPGIIDGINGIFDPAFATVDTHIVTYTVTDPITGGVSVAPVTIRVHPKPIVNFDIGTFCAQDSIQFTDLTTVANVFSEDTIVRWEWNFNNERFEKDQNPMMFFKDPGLKSVSLSVKTLATSDGCVADTTFTDIYGKVPKVDFDWSNICFQDTTRFIELAELDPGSLDTESNYSWNFGDGNSVSGTPGIPFSISHPDGSVTFSSVGYEQPNHRYANAATGDFFGANLIVQTSSGCIENLSKTVEILPSESLSLTGGAYIADFNVDESGWFDDPEFEGDTSSWLWDAGQGFWWTGDNAIPSENWTYLNNENSVVNGPCFDFTGISRPMIALDYWVDNEDGKDGIVFEYSIDGFEWFVVGEADGSGQFWYNDDGIVSRPGYNNGFNNVSNAGWTTKENINNPALSDGYLQWRNARYTLPEAIIGLSKIRIRFHFASNADNENVLMRGFGFDNIFVGEKQKTVLLENFASLNDYPDYLLFQNKMLNLNANLLDDDVIYINYNISANNPDTLHQDNPDVPRIRSNKYGISNPIHSILDGSADIDFGFSGRYQDPGLTQQGIDSRSLITPQLTIDNVTVLTTATNEIEVQWSIRALEDIDRPIRIYTGIFEKNFVLNDPGAIYDGDVLYNTMKQMLPNTNGLSWNQPWVNGQSAGIASFLDANGFTGETSLIWDINEVFVPIHNPDSLAVVVFIQDEETNEIYQAAVQNVVDPKQGVEPLALEDELVGELDNITIYPNPVLDDMHFVLEDALRLSREDFYWKIIDQRGLTMLEGDLLFRNGRITIDTSDIPNGLYHLVMGIQSKPLSYRKIAIMHR